MDPPSLPLLLLLQQQCLGETSLLMPSMDLCKMYTWRENAGSQGRHKSNWTKYYLIVFQSDCSNPYPAQQSTQVPVSSFHQHLALSNFLIIPLSQWQSDSSRFHLHFPKHQWVWESLHMLVSYVCFSGLLCLFISLSICLIGS